jgi:hypothetical protein
LGGLKGEHESSAGEDGGLSEAGDCLALPVTETVVVIWWPPSVAHADEGDDGGSHVNERVDGGGEQHNRIRSKPSGEFDHDQSNGNDECCPSGEPAQTGVTHQVVLFFNVRLRHIILIGHRKSQPFRSKN